MTDAGGTEQRVAIKPVSLGKIGFTQFEPNQPVPGEFERIAIEHEFLAQGHARLGIIQLPQQYAATFQTGAAAEAHLFEHLQSRQERSGTVLWWRDKAHFQG